MTASCSVANGYQLCDKNALTKRWPSWCLCLGGVTLLLRLGNPGSKVHGANMDPIWGRQDPGGPHVGPMNFVIWECMDMKIQPSTWKEPTGFQPLQWELILTNLITFHDIQEMRWNLVRCWNNVAHIVCSTLFGSARIYNGETPTILVHEDNKFVCVLNTGIKKILTPLGLILTSSYFYLNISPTNIKTIDTHWK